VQRLSDAYRRIRNTARYILSNIHDFDPATDMVADADLLEIDRWALSRLETLVARIEKSYDEYEFHQLYQAVHNFCSVELSSIYLDILKDRVYTSATTGVERRSAQSAMYRILDALTRLIAPVLSFTADEIWQKMPGERETSVHLAAFPHFETSLLDAHLDEVYQQLWLVRSDVSKALELARDAKLIGNSLEAKVTLNLDGVECRELLEKYADQLATLFIVSQVELVESCADDSYKSEKIEGLQVVVAAAAGEKCERCWNYSTQLGSDSTYPDLCPRCAAVLRASVEG